jgi:hypothetical protein
MEEVWDEHEWEDFLREADRRTELYLRVLEAYVREHPPPPEAAPEAEHEAWQRALDAHLALRMGWNPEDAPPAPEDLGEGEDVDEGEGWKADAPDLYPEAVDVRDLPLWQAAQAFAQAVLRWADAVPEDLKDDGLVDACANALLVQTKLAGAHAMGYEPDTLGGNIAQTKRALHAANRALAALHALRGEPSLPARDFWRLYEQGYEVRNAVGLHVQALRERFEEGGA